jgi:hypothetical protein
MFYKKQNSSSSIFTVSICIIMLGVGFLLGYVFTSFTAGENYKQRETQLKAQIAQLEQSGIPASVGNDPDGKPSSSPGLTNHGKTTPSPDRIDPPDQKDENSGVDGEDDAPTNAPPDISPSSSDDPSNIISVLPNDDDEKEPDDSEFTQGVGNSTDEKIQEKYIFKIYNNKLAIFDYTNDQVGEVQTIINTDINFLSKADRLMLEKGIIIENEEQLSRILEDYTS